MRNLIVAALVLVGCVVSASASAQQAATDPRLAHGEALLRAVQEQQKANAAKYYGAAREAVATEAPPPAPAPLPAAPVCESDITTTRMSEARPVTDKLMLMLARSMSDAETLQSRREGIATVREVARRTRCILSLFDAKDRVTAETFTVHAEKWSAEWTAKFDAEEAARTSIIVPLCMATWEVENARANIARERANPGGVQDLHVLHDAGQIIQMSQDSIRALKPRYLAHRKHAFTTWQTEGACVAASKR